VVPMRGQVNRIGWRSACGLTGVSLLLSLGGCDWLFGSSTPANTATVRPGAERQIGPSNALPSAGGGHGYDAPATPIDETRSGPKIGSILPDKGGQKAQLEAVAKEQAERDKKAREERERAARDAAERKAQEKEASKDGKATKAPTNEPPTQPSIAPSAPVTTAPVPPPAGSPADQKS
jgi:hypothetical protein